MIKFIFLLLSISYGYSANWLMIQGTQEETTKDHNLWGFGQLRYIHNRGDIYETYGMNKTPFSLNKPDLQKQETFILSRLRIGLRGRLDVKNKINYFILTEFGENGITNPAGYRQHSYLTDLSVTLRYLPINIRVGQYKYPGSEEGLMARFASPFIQFTTVSDQLMLERYISSQSENSTTYLGRPAHSVGAYRDSGIKLFQQIDLDKTSSITYAYMYGLGSGIQMDNVNDSHPTHYLYMAYENIFGAIKGYNTESLKLYGWYQKGKRKLLDELYNRTRYGIGLTYYDGSLRVEGEYMKGKGMIFTGAKDTSSTPSNNVWQFEIEADKNNKADGYYISATYKLQPNIEAIARYDEYHRMENISAKERSVKNTTLGFSYKFEGVNRIDFNYTFVKAYAPYNGAAQDILNNAGDIARIQLTWVYK
ncbi:MAG: hypothetical protein WBM70_09030 [Sulfurovum sp.]|uniref:hypothetical protein n=1 Tax=Sulfurovum sp. TaxID=1969726 RepID=UPI003C738DEB